MLQRNSFILLLLLTLKSLISCEGSSLTFVIDDSGSMADDIDQVRRGASGIMDIVLKHKASQIKDIVLVTFNDPSGDKAVISDMRGPSSNYETVMSTTNVKVLKLNNPVPGTYELKVFGEGQVSVNIFGRTDFVFEHGFSEMTPKSVRDTSKQPISGTKNHLSISVVDPDHEVNIKSAQILNMNEEIMHELQLRKIGNDFYITDQFVAPNSMFKVAVIGQVIKTGKGIRRIAKTPVEPQKPKIKPIDKKAPLSEISEGSKTSIAYDSTFRLTCTVTGYPQPTITWKDDKGIVLSSETHPVELPYKYLSYLSLSHIKKSGKYHCYGNNELGNTHSSIDVKVLPALTADVAPKGPLNVNYGKEAVIHCKIQSSLPKRIYWYRVLNNKPIQEQITTSDKYTISSDGSELKIKFMDIGLQGKYICKANLIADENEKATYETEVKIPDLAKPEILKSNPTMTIREKTRFVIPCKIVKGNPKPKITWQFRSKDSTSFQPLPNTGEQLEVISSKLSDAGYYACTAENELGKIQQVTELIVEAPPSIITDDKKEIYAAIVGDRVLRIPCKAVGYPKPIIAWKLKGQTIKTDTKYAVEKDGTLVIKTPVEKDTSDKYVCEATNKFSTASEKFNVDVTTYLLHDDHFGDCKKIYILAGSSKQVKCGLYKSNTDSVRWYKNRQETNITQPFLDFINATQDYDGNYTCRVNTNLGSYSETYEVDVGYPPRFKLDFISPEIDWKGDKDSIVNCDVISKPAPKVKWTYNGKNVKGATETELEITKWGEYSCEISNPHGKVQRSYKVTTKDCLINRDNNATPTMPLILTGSPTWRDLETQNEYLVIKSGSALKLSCVNQASKPNHFARFSSKAEVTATCDHNENFLVDGNKYKLSDLGCKSDVLPAVVRTGTKCLNDNTELIKVGFNVDGFVKAYEVCFDTKNNLPIYTHVEMSDVNNFASVSEQKWHNYLGIEDSKSGSRYTCQKGSESCCFSKNQLISADDVHYGPPQTSTFIDYLNAVPVWQPCDKSRISWHNLESIVRAKFYEQYEFSVWSGTSKLVAVNGTTIPRYLWKVVTLDQADAIAMVYVNDPEPTASDILCENACDEEIAWAGPSDTYTYCCRLADFVQAFNYTMSTFNQ